jgi:hypothetical protein
MGYGYTERRLFRTGSKFIQGLLSSLCGEYVRDVRVHVAQCSMANTLLNGWSTSSQRVGIIQRQCHHEHRHGL